MPKPKKTSKPTSRFVSFLKRRPKTSITLTVILVAVVGFAISQEIEQQTQAHKLRVADQKIQQFADEIEKADPTIKLQRKKYCRHNDEKYGKGALICVVSVNYEHKHIDEQDLQAKIEKFKFLIKTQTALPGLEFQLERGDEFRSTTSSGGTGYKLNGDVVIGISYQFNHFEGEPSKQDGVSYLHIGASEKVHRPIFRYID